jgi:hypothetical protein
MDDPVILARDQMLSIPPPELVIGLAKAFPVPARGTVAPAVLLRSGCTVLCGPTGFEKRFERVPLMQDENVAF